MSDDALALPPMYGDLKLPLGLTLASAREAARLVNDWERNEGDFEECFDAIPLVVRLFAFFQNLAEEPITRK